MAKKLIFLYVVILLVIVFQNQIECDNDNASNIRIYFSPNGGAETAIANALKSAKKQICVAMYMFTNRTLSRCLANAKRRGIKVYVILDKKKRNCRYSQYKYLKSNGINVRVLDIDKKREDDKFHHKFAVVDDKIVTTGSFNWTSAAERRNCENELVIYSKKIAAVYGKEFVRLFKLAEK